MSLDDEKAAIGYIFRWGSQKLHCAISGALYDPAGSASRESGVYRTGEHRSRGSQCLFFQEKDFISAIEAGLRG